MVLFSSHAQAAETDHLKIFSDDRITLEDILAKDGVKVKKGIKVQETGDIEILPDEEPSKA
ncbi:hypothetical protein YB2330_001256 [Saitoella coloradoensis]